MRHPTARSDEARALVERRRLMPAQSANRAAQDDRLARLLDDAQAAGDGGCSVAVVCFGLQIGLRVCDVALLAPVLACLPPAWTPSTGGALSRTYRVECAEDVGPDRYRLWIDDHPFGPDLDLDGICRLFEADIQMYVAEFADPWLFLHAGVVAWQGRGIVLPGRSFAGKSTLVAALVAAGATYYSDEYAVFDGNGRVVPFPRHLSLRDGPFGSSGRLDFSDLAPTGDQTDCALEVSLVAMLRFKEAGGWKLRKLGSGEAVMAMANHMVAIRRRPAPTLDILSKIAMTARVFEGTRGGAAHAAHALLRLAEH